MPHDRGHMLGKGLERLDVAKITPSLGKSNPVGGTVSPTTLSPKRTKVMLRRVHMLRPTVERNSPATCTNVLHEDAANK